MSKNRKAKPAVTHLTCDDPFTRSLLEEIKHLRDAISKACEIYEEHPEVASRSTAYAILRDAIAADRRIGIDDL